MTRIHRLIIILTVLIGLLSSGCAKILKPDEALGQLEQEYIGKPIDAMVLRFGIPEKEYVLQNGNTLYFFRNEKNTESESLSRYTVRYQYKCNLTATTDLVGIVTDIKAESVSTHPYSRSGCNKLILQEW